MAFKTPDYLSKFIEGMYSSWRKRVHDNKSKQEHKFSDQLIKQFSSSDLDNSKELKNPKLVASTLLECIRTGDTESFREVLTAHLLTVNKSVLAKKMGVARRTLYALIDPKKPFNPELSTLSAIIKELGA